jgi:periplasmic protein TonB
MELKKTEKADLSNKRGLFFSIGLVLTLSCLLFAFEWKSYDGKVDLLSAKSTNTFEEMLEVPTTQQPPPAAPVIQQPQIIEVPDEEEIKEELNISLDTEAPRIDVAPVAVEEHVEEVDEIFTIVEESASPTGGMTSFYKYLVDNMKYPPQARRLGIEGKVTVSFVVDKSGAISDVMVLKGIGSGCDEEAIRVMRSAPPWNPGKQRGKPVRQRCIMPISFKI